MDHAKPRVLVFSLVSGSSIGTSKIDYSVSQADKASRSQSSWVQAIQAQTALFECIISFHQQASVKNYHSQFDLLTPTIDTYIQFKDCITETFDEHALAIRPFGSMPNIPPAYCDTATHSADARCPEWICASCIDPMYDTYNMPTDFSTVFINNC